MTFDWKSLIPWIISLVTISIGIWQYVDKAAQANREPFLREQLRLAVETSEVVSRLATGTDPVKWETDRSRFWALYYGPLAIVEDTEVERQMVVIGKIVPRPGTPSPTLPFMQLTGSALQINIKLRALILRAWQMDVSHLELREVTR